MNVNLPPSLFLEEFILEAVTERTLTERILVYRALAATSKRVAVASECTRMANDLERLESRHRQLLLGLSPEEATDDPPSGGSN